MEKFIRIFISYDFNEDDDFKDSFLHELRRICNKDRIVDLSFVEAVPEEIWEFEVEKRLEQSDIVVVLVGRYTHMASGVIKEIRICRKLGLPVHVMYILPNVQLCPLPSELDSAIVLSKNPPLVMEEILNTHRSK